MRIFTTLSFMLYIVVGFSQSQTNKLSPSVRNLEINREWKNQVNPTFQGFLILIQLQE